MTQMGSTGFVGERWGSWQRQIDSSLSMESRTERKRKASIIFSFGIF